MFTPDVEPDTGVVVRVSSVPYATKKGVYEVYVQTSTQKTGTEEDTAVEVWTDEEPLVFDVPEDGQSTTPDVGTVGSAGGGCDSGLSLAGLVIWLSLPVMRRKL